MAGPARRDPNDAWVECTCGSRHWGLAGAAGLALVDRATRTIALQLRSVRSHQGGTWGLPGGAIGTGETPLQGALREAAEEADVHVGDVVPDLTSVLDHGVWSYTTVLAHVDRDGGDPGAPRPVLRPVDWESDDLRWVDLDDVADLPLHPAFATAWPGLRVLADADPVLVVDVANVLGSRPDGWWRDRAGATGRLLTVLGAAVATSGPGVAADWFGLDADAAWPRTVAVLEGAARDAVVDLPPDSRLEVVLAPGSGDDAVVAAVDAVAVGGSPGPLVVATADRGLRERMPTGARTLGPGALRKRILEA